MRVFKFPAKNTKIEESTPSDLSSKFAFFRDALRQLHSYVHSRDRKDLDKQFLSRVFIALLREANFGPVGISARSLSRRTHRPLRPQAIRQQILIDFISEFRSKVVTTADVETADKQRTATYSLVDDNLFRSAVNVIVALNAGGPKAASLCEMFAQEGRPFAESTASAHEGSPTSDTASVPIAPDPATMHPVPDVAPALWADRPKKHGTSPAQFIRDTYAFCIANLGMHHLWHLDKTLYKRYSDWKNDDANAGDLVNFGVSIRLDDAERGRRAREQTKATKANQRGLVKNRDNLPQMDP